MDWCKNIPHNCDLILYLGCGDLKNLPEAFDKAIHLVDANEGVCKRLERRFKGQDNVKVHHRTLWHNDDECMYRRYNLDDFDGLGKPTGLKDLYPGLRELESSAAHPQRLDEFVKELGIDVSNSVFLVLDVPGGNSKLIEHLIDKNVLHCYTSLLILQPSESLYDAELTSEQLVTRLEEQCYIVLSNENTDGIFAKTELIVNPLFDQLEFCNRTIEGLVRKGEEIQRDYQRNIEEQTKQQERLEQALNSYSQDVNVLEEKSRFMQDQIDELVKERDGLKELTEELQGLVTAQSAELNQNVEALTQCMEQRDQYENQRNQLVHERDDQVLQRECLENERQELMQEVENLQATLSASTLKNKKIEAELLKTNIQFELVREILPR